MTDFGFYVDDVTWFSPFILPFLLCLAVMSDCDFEWSPPEFIQAGLHLLGHSFAPIPAPSPLLLPFLLFSSLVKILAAVLLLFRFASNSASHFRSAWACHLTPSVYSSLTIFLLSSLHLRHLVYKCSTDFSVPPHHQHSGVSMAFILAKRSPLHHVQLWADKIGMRISLERSLALGLCRSFPGNIEATTAGFSILYLGLMPLKEFIGPYFS